MLVTRHRTGALAVTAALLLVLVMPAVVLAAAPVAADDGYNVAEDDSLAVAAPGVLANDTDADLDPLTAVKDTNPTDGNVTLGADGSFTYTPDPDFAGTDSFTYHVEAGGESSNTATVTITVSPVNDAPVAVANSYSTPEDVPRVVAAPGVLGNDSDPDPGNSLTAAAVSQPSHGTLSLGADGGFTYTPAANYNGPDSFTYRANDGTVNSNIVTVSLTITAVNDAPTVVGDAYTTNEDVALNRNQAATALLANDSDVEGDAFTAISVTQPSHGSVSMFDPDGTFRYTPNANYNGTDTFTYRATDGTTQSAPATVTITVNPVNDIPVAVGDAYTTPEDVQLIVSAPGVLTNDSDVDGQALTATVVTQPSHGTLSLSTTGGFTYTPAANYNGADSFTYRANDGTANSNTVTVSLTITAVSDAPTATDDTGTTNEDTPLVVGAPGVLSNDSDPEGLGLTASVVGQPAHGTLTLNANGGYTYTPTSNYNGSDSFTYRANSASTPSNTATVSLTITAVNDPPVAGADTGTINEDTSLVVAAPGVLSNDTDVDSVALTAGVVVGPAHGTLTLNANGGYTYTPTANYSGADSFTYRASDGSALSNTVTVTLTVTPINDPPVAVADTRTTNEDTVLSGATVLGNDSDPDSGTITAVLDSQPARGTLVLNANGTFTYTPLLNDNGSVSFSYHASDGTLSSNTVSVAITITAVNDAPVAVADSATTAEDNALVVAAPGLRSNDTDVDTALASLVASIVSQPVHGTAVVNGNGSYTFTPTLNYNGPDSFTYRVFDGAAFSSAGTVTLTVTPVNDAPVASSDAYSASEDVPLVVAAASGVLADDTDVDSASLTAALVVGPTHGTLAFQATGGFSYTPALDYHGPDSFTYRASDGSLQSGVTLVTLTVASVNDPPTFVLGPNPTVAEDSGIASYPNFLSGIDPGPADESGQTVTVAPLQVATPLLFSQQPAIDGAGKLTFKPAANRTGSSLVTVTATDNGGTANGGDDTGSQTFTIFVSGSNDPPTANSDSYGTQPDDDGPRIEAGIVTSLDVLANDFTAPDLGETLTIVGVTKPGHGTVSIAPGGSSLNYRSTKGYAGSDSFVYTISDGVYTDTARVFLTIADTLAPTLGSQTFRFPTGAKLTFPVKVKLGWSASDPGSGVKSYDVRQSTNGGASWTMIYFATTATSATRSFAFGTHYTYQFRARDKGGRRSGWSAPVSFTPARYQESTALATYSSNWKSATISSASGNHTKFAKGSGALSTFSFTGRAVSLVAPRSSWRGKADIRVDGVLVATVNLYRTSTDARHHVWSRSWGAVGPHVVTVTVRGTIGHPRFDVDAWTDLK
jgi:VCBS repeat-containing protein